MCERVCVKERERHREGDKEGEWVQRKGEREGEREIFVGWRGQTGFLIISACTEGGSQLKLAF